MGAQLPLEKLVVVRIHCGLPFENMQAKEQHRINNLKLYHKRRSEFIELLGGKCVDCGTTEDLQFDHVNPIDKSFDVGSRLSYAYETVLAGVKKCVLRCKRCHNVKTNLHGDTLSFKITKEQADSIRNLYKSGRYTQSQLAGMFNIAQNTVSAIVLNKRWVN